MLSHLFPGLISFDMAIKLFDVVIYGSSPPLNDIAHRRHAEVQPISLYSLNHADTTDLR